MSLYKLISKSNLCLAWRRITTSNDARYKQFFRHIYEAYELNYDLNIKDLRRRIKDNEYHPSEPVRIYYPKASGLQRPITLMALEDQILLQALANISAEKFRERRQPLIGKAVFSNLLSRKATPEFFIRYWKFGYQSLRRRLVQLYEKGYTWITIFDLSAFYDTIPHDLLLKTIFPRVGDPMFLEKVQGWLRCWSSAERSTQHGHGIPQGPRASDFLAECIMLPIDEKMAGEYVYLRYVDDIRILGRTELELRQALVYLDILCRERGLIPNSNKSEIKQITSANELVSEIPNIMAYIDSADGQFLNQVSCEKLISESIKSLDGRIEITDRSKLRYTLFRAPASDLILELVLNLWGHAPEHVDAFSVFLDNYARVDKVVSLCKDLLKKRYPYDYVRGEMWKLLARMSKPREMRPLISIAIDTVKNEKKGSAARIGVYAFLCKCESLGMGSHSNWVMYEQSPIIQAVSAPYIKIEGGKFLKLINQMLNRSLADPSLALIRNLQAGNINLEELGKSKNDLQPVVQNVYHAAGLLPGAPRYRTDPIGNILSSRYSVPKWNKWKDIFGSQYQHALMLLTHSEAYFKPHPSAWLGQLDAFNDAWFRAFQSFLSSKGSSGVVRTTNRGGRLEDYGNLIALPTFTSAYPTLAGHLKAIHDRRKTLPLAHAYEKRTGAKSQPLRKAEQRNLAARMSAVIREITQAVELLGI